MLPSRSTLEGWNPDALGVSSNSVATAGEVVGDAVSGIDDAINRMPEVGGWSGDAHDAATKMFGRADAAAQRFTAYTDAVATALSSGANALGQARSALLAKADAVDAGPLSVSDQWVVLVDPERMSVQQFAQLRALADQEQGVINTLLSAVGDADDATADAILAAGTDHGFVPPAPPTGLPGLMLPTPSRPADQVPDPRTVIGQQAQSALRSADEMQAVREVVEGENQYGEQTTTVIKQDGSKAVITEVDDPLLRSKLNMVEMEEFDKDGNFIARTSTWRELGSGVDYTSITYADNGNLTITRSPNGTVNAGFTTPGGTHRAVPVELIDQLSNTAGGAMSGLEKLPGAGAIPGVTDDAIERIVKTSKFGGPALTVATTAFDYMMADSPRDQCLAIFGGIGGAGGGWGGAEFGAWVGAFGGPYAPITVPLAVVVGATAGGLYGGDLGKAVGGIFCPP